MQRFWMVLGSGPPVAQHRTLKIAMDEAERLARLNPASTFTVLEAIAQCRYSQVVWREADDSDDAKGTTEIPF
jgi:hypothetical protein